MSGGIGVQNEAMLLLENQLCFPLYACSKEVVRHYKPFLDKLDLTYTQYIVMMVMWEKKQLTFKSLGELLRLDSGTLTPVMKKLVAKGYLTRERSAEDERVVTLTLTDEGEALKRKALEVPPQMRQCIRLSNDEMMCLRRILDRMIRGFDELDESGQWSASGLDA